MKRYDVKFSNRSIKELNKLDKSQKVILYSWIKEHLDKCSNPRTFGKALSGDLKGLWRYRVGDYRIIVDIRDNEVVILVLTIGHRREVCR